MNLIVLFFRHPRSLLFAFMWAAAAFTLVALLSQLRVLLDVGHHAPAELGVVLVATIYGTLVAGSPESLVLIIVSFLFGLVAAGIGLYLRAYRAVTVSSIAAFGAGGSISGLLALACLSCGSLLAAILSSVFSASGLLIVSAYQGAVFAGVSIALLLSSLFILNRRLADAARASL